MAFTRPLYMQPAGGDAAITYTAAQDRDGLVRALVSREGVFDLDAIASPGLLRQRAAGANMSIDVQVFRGAVVGDDVANQGTYLIGNDTVANITTFSTGSALAAPGSGTRRHRVVARVRDKLSNGSWTTYDWLPQILQDTGSGAPAEPASAITLGYVNIAAAQSSIVNANLEQLTARASVGTAARQGTLSFISAYSPDTLRPPSWHVNADGWVSLAGWVGWAGTSQTIAAGDFSDGMLAVAVPAAIQPSTYRDMTMTSMSQPVHAVMRPDGNLYWRPWWSYPLTPAVTWWSLDGMGYRL